MKTDLSQSSISKEKKEHEVSSKTNNCHQCKRKDRARTIGCRMCNKKHYCVKCINKWYHGMPEEVFAEKCPVCSNNCNCKACLRLEVSIDNRRKLNVELIEKESHSQYILYMLLPFLKQFSAQQIIEKEFEAKIKGLPVSAIKVPKALYKEDETLYCKKCMTSIVDFHRSCSLCSYALCLTCSGEIREGHLQGNEDVIMPYINRGIEYLHGGNPIEIKSDENLISSMKTEICCSPVKSVSDWKSKDDGSIPCPSKVMDGCGEGILELKSLLGENWVYGVLTKAEKALKTDGLRVSEQCFPCSKAEDAKLRKASSRENDVDNFLYCPTATDITSEDLKHFQWHWCKGEPVIVGDVLQNALGLSWEPMVIWRAFRQVKNNTLDVSSLNCLDWCERNINVHTFFKGYSQGLADNEGWPLNLKLKDWPPSHLFKDLLPRHYVEIITSLPFKMYTHPNSGSLNLATKLDRSYLNLHMGPKMDISYGITQELGRGNSVNKIQCNVSDVVNILTHTQAVELKPEKLLKIEKLEKKHDLQDQKEIAGTFQRRKVDIDNRKSRENIPSEVDDARAGAIWDVFRREDVEKLEEYLRKYFKEFRHIFCSPIQQVVHPIFDQTFYLTKAHKMRLQKEYGIEPWTFVQKLGDAVFIPAGCPYQVRNLKSCISVSLNFLSPENIHECIRLTEEIQKLPQNHMAKKDHLEVNKMCLNAITTALNELEKLENSLDTTHMEDEGRNEMKARRHDLKRKWEYVTVDTNLEGTSVSGATLKTNHVLNDQLLVSKKASCSKIITNQSPRVSFHTPYEKDYELEKMRALLKQKEQSEKDLQQHLAISKEHIRTLENKVTMVEDEKRCLTDRTTQLEKQINSMQEIGMKVEKLEDRLVAINKNHQAKLYQAGVEAVELFKNSDKFDDILSERISIILKQKEQSEKELQRSLVVSKERLLTLELQMEMKEKENKKLSNLVAQLEVQKEKIKDAEKSVKEAQIKARKIEDLLESKEKYWKNELEKASVEAVERFKGSTEFETILFNNNAPSYNKGYDDAISFLS